MRAGVPESEYRERVERVQAEAQRLDLDGILAWSKGGGPVDAYADVFYLTGWYTPFPRIEDQPPVWAGRAYGAVWVPAQGDATLIVDVPDYRSDLIVAADVRAGINVPATAAEVIKDAGAARGRIGLSASETMLVGSYNLLRDALPDAQLVAADSIIADLRMIKSDAEIMALKRAADVGSELVSEMLRAAQRPGTTEAQAVAAAWKVGIELGAAPWDSAVASGPNSDYYAWQGLPSWSLRELDAGDIFHVDTYGSVDGYLYDISRSCVCGEKASDDQREVLEGAIGCTSAMIDAVKPGVTAEQIFEVGSSFLRERDLAGGDDDGDVRVALVSSFPAHGHGLGTTLESPWLRPGERTPLQERMALAIECMAGRPEVGAAKFEQDVIVTADGCEMIVAAPAVWWS
jgi:Xaa-Pro aminopeptidase